MHSITIDQIRAHGVIRGANPDGTLIVERSRATATSNAVEGYVRHRTCGSLHLYRCLDLAAHELRFQPVGRRRPLPFDCHWRVAKHEATLWLRQLANQVANQATA
jgi:hypothetical protein